MIVKSVDLNVHLAGGNTISCAGYFEIHISKMILIAENIGKHCIRQSFLDQSHGDAGYRFSDRNTSVHQRKRSAAY